MKLSSKRVYKQGESVSFANLEEFLKQAPGAPSRRPAGEMHPRTSSHLHESSYAEGFEVGFQQGLQTVLANEQARIATFDAELRALVRRVEQALELWFQKAEDSLARLARAVARKVIATEIEARPELITPIVREALGYAKDSTSVRIRVNPFDLPTLEERRSELLAACAGIQGIEIVGDESLSRGSTIIETEGGVIDATVESKLDNLFQSELADAASSSGPMDEAA